MVVENLQPISYKVSECKTVSKMEQSIWKTIETELKNGVRLWNFVWPEGQCSWCIRKPSSRLWYLWPKALGMTFIFGRRHYQNFYWDLKIHIEIRRKVGQFRPYLAAELIDPDTRVGGTRSRLTRGLEQSFRRAFFWLEGGVDLASHTSFFVLQLKMVRSLYLM